jgi:leucyl aminopeptidase
MPILNLKLTATEKPPSRAQIEACHHWIFLLAGTLTVAEIMALPFGRELMQRHREMAKRVKETDPVTLDLPNKQSSRVAFASPVPGISAFNLLELARKLTAVHSQTPSTRLGLLVYGFAPKAAERMAEGLVAAVWAAAAPMPSFKQDAPPGPGWRQVSLYGIKPRDGFRRTRAEAEGNAVARSFSMLPSNLLNPGRYVKEARQLAREHGWRFEFLDLSTLRRRKAGAFLAVAQGSAARDAGIVHLRYRPKSGNPRRSLALVGKGICYDTGGVNLKSARHMFGMHEDMQGSAVALGTLIALTQCRANYSIDCYLAIAMNEIGSRAYKPNDVITAMDGTTIEIVDTDAEGRLVLADALALACGRKPGLIIDYATLTGDCTRALGNGYSGVFTNREPYLPLLIAAGKDSGERVWPFPMDADYDRHLESRIADIKQCAIKDGTDHILAARFLQRFVKHDIAWVHVDLSAGNHKGGLAHVPTDVTGFGIRFTLNLLLDKKIL